MPNAFASLEIATAHPSLLLNTITGRFSSEGLKTLSHETKKLLQSISPIMNDVLIASATIFLDCIGHNSPNIKAVVGSYLNRLEGFI